MIHKRKGYNFKDYLIKYYKKKQLYYTVVLVLLTLNGFSQPIVKGAKDAFLITRMAEKHHIKPRPLNEQFSIDFFNLLISNVDEDKMFLTIEDIQQLQPSKQLLHKEIANKSTVFLQSLVNIYQKRLQQADTMLTTICAKPFNFTIDEKYTAAEDTTYPKNELALRIKLYKNVKLFVLQGLAELQNEKNATKQKSINDSAELSLRKRIEKVYKRYIQKQLNAPGGIAQVISNEYCKAVALCYDPHTSYMSETDRENFESQLGRKNKVFGFAMDESDDGKTTISSLQPGSAAFKSGQINVGDKIIAIQWDNQQPIDVSDATLEETASILEASNHAKATLTILKADGTKRTVDLYKEEQTQDDDDDLVKSFILNGTKKIGYIYLPSFYEDWEDKTRANGCANDIAKEIVKLKKDKIDGLILDLRYNGGGSVLEAVDLAGIFIDAGPIAQSKSKEPKPYTLKDLNRGTIYDGPMSVLINGYSASASELLASTLQDYHRAVIMGSNSYGKATGQRVLPLDTTIDLNSDLTKVNKAAYLKLTLSQIFRVAGTTAQFNGVTPDIHMPDKTEVSNTKEKNERFAIPASAIEANKYYLPLPVIALEPLKNKAKELIAKDAYFSKLEAYINNKNEEAVADDIPLKLSTYLKMMTDDSEEEAEEDETETSELENTLFTVETNSFEKQRLQKSKFQLLLSEEKLKQFAKNPYLKVVYAVMLEMIK